MTLFASILHCSYLKMKKPIKRPDLPPRRSDNEKRRLDPDPDPDPDRIALLSSTIRYRGSPKHKRYPHLFGLEMFNGKRGDATLCDEHAGFSPQDMETIPEMIERGLRAGLVGKRMIWTVANNGQIFEARLTNSNTNEYHGYPVRSFEAIAESVYRRFAEWAAANGNSSDRNAVEACLVMYEFKK